MTAVRSHTSGIIAPPSPLHKDGRKKVLEIRGLKTHFQLEEGLLEAVRGVDLTLFEEEMVALVGESGCGKSVSAMSVLGLMNETRAKIVAGEVWYFPAAGKPVDLSKIGRSEMSKIRGKEIAMIFQDPLTSLNPVLTVGEQISEAIRKHSGASWQKARKRTADLFEVVGLPDVSRKLDSYPHELSGGMRQRIMIAMALALNPRLLIADEPTTALDVTIQAQILELLFTLRKDFKTAILLITHDLGVVAQTCSHVNVMYAGRIVESCPTRAFFADPKHPYSKGLIESLPKLHEEKQTLVPIPGQPPDLIGLGAGCPFAPRCGQAMEVCSRKYPPRFSLGADRVECWLYESDAGKRNDA